jgi:hypothetical protein
MWANVQNSITSANDNPIGAASAGVDKVLGPSYDYLKDIQSPGAKGVSSAGTMDQVFTNTGAIGGYVNNLLLGPKLGNQLFSDTGGTCKAPNGSVVRRWTWINNKLGAKDAAGVLGKSFQDAVGGDGLDGIIPGMGGDIASMNPLKVMNALVLNASPPCQAFTCPVTLSNGSDNGTETHFMSPSLELNMTGCKKVENSSDLETSTVKLEKASAATARYPESFTPYFSSSYGPNVLVNTDPTPTILLGVAVALFLGYVVMRVS